MPFASAQHPPIEKAPFDLTWVKGGCPKCDAKWTLDSVQFTSHNEAWGVGAHWPPPGGQGLGDRIVLHTQDRGRTWTPLPQTGQVTVSPDVFFVSQRRGWIGYGQVMGHETVLQTDDGGQSWTTVSGRFPLFPEFLDSDHWCGIRDNLLLRTADAGTKWRSIPIPEVNRPETYHFLTSDLGWVVTVSGKSFLISRTIDGGDSWEHSRVATGKEVAGINDLFFLDEDRGWIITAYNMDGSDIFATVDGGKTWTRQADPAFEGPHKLAASVTFLSKTLGFVFFREDPPARNSAVDDTVITLPWLAYTSDAGGHWQKLQLPYHVSNCRPFDGDLICTARDKRPGPIILILHLK